MKNKVLGIAAFAVLLATVDFASAAEYRVVWTNKLPYSSNGYFSVTVKPLPVPGAVDITSRNYSNTLEYGQSLTMIVSAPTCAAIELKVRRFGGINPYGIRLNKYNAQLSATTSCASTVTATITEESSIRIKLN